MVIVNELLRVGRLSGYNHPPILSPYAVDFLQLVGVNPLINYIFVLLFSVSWLC